MPWVATVCILAQVRGGGGSPLVAVFVLIARSTRCEGRGNKQRERREEEAAGRNTLTDTTHNDTEAQQHNNASA
jgi:hypothetical protein